MGAVQSDGLPGPGEPGAGSGGEESTEHVAAAQQPADAAPPAPGASPADDAPSGEVPPSAVGVAAGPPPPVGGPAAPQPGYAAWPPPAPGGPYPPGPYPPAQPYAAGPYAPAQPYAAGPYAPAQPYPPGPYAPAYPAGPYAPYPAPSIGRQPSKRPSWAAPSPTRTHRWGLGAYLLAEAVFLLVGGLISLYVILTGAEPTVGLLVLGLAAPTVLAAAVALLITKLRGNGPRVDLCLGWSWRDVGLGLAFGFGGLALTIPASMVFVAIVGDDASSAVGDALGGLRAGPVLAVVVLLVVVVIAPMCEEILYRGLLWGGVERIAGRWAAFGVTTALFALAHFEITRTPLLLVVAIPIAIARLYTGRLLPAIIAHQVNNLLPGIMLMLGLLGVVPMA